jgi:hypothetical protein
MRDEEMPNRKEAVSEKKIAKGDGGWCQRKEILGWMINTCSGTMELTNRRKERVQQIFEDLRGKKRVSVKKWQRVLGKLRFMGAAIPGSAGLFRVMQLGLKHADQHQVQITPYLWDHLTDFKMLAASVSGRPTRLAKVVPDYPSVIGAVDSAKPGMGGVLFAEGEALIMWRAQFPEDIQQWIVSSNNPTGDLTNSDLEQAGVLAQADIANTTYDLRDRRLATLNDNTAAVSRNRKGALTSDQAGAYLCRMTSLHQRHHRYCHVVSYMSGEAQEMAADTLSHHHDLSDEQLLMLFDLRFPQEKPWRMCHLPDEMLLALNCLLRWK